MRFFAKRTGHLLTKEQVSKIFTSKLVQFQVKIVHEKKIFPSLFEICILHKPVLEIQLNCKIHCTTFDKLELKRQNRLRFKLSKAHPSRLGSQIGHNDLHS